MSINELEGKVLDLLGPISKGRYFQDLTLTLTAGRPPRVEAVELYHDGYVELRRSVCFEFRGETWLAVGGTV